MAEPRGAHVRPDGIGIHGVVVALVAAAAAACASSGGGAAASSQRFWSRPDLEPPVVQVLTRPRETTAGYLFIAAKKNTPQAGPMILDGHGRLVWFHPLNTKGVTDLRVQFYRGRSVLTWWQARPTGATHGSSYYAVADPSYRTLRIVRPVGGPAADPHEILLTPRGTALMTTFRSIVIGGRRVADGGVQELDLRTGRVLLDWRSTHHVAFSESYSKQPRRTSIPYDFFHVNSIDIDADGNLIVSARNTHAVYKIDRHTGRVIWRLGGKRSDFVLGRNVRFAWQHDARRHEDGTISIFDNGASPQVHRQSRVLFLRLDAQRKVAKLVRYLVHRPPRLAINQGNAQLLPRAHVLVGWGHESYITEYDRRGRVLLELRFGDGGADSYRAFRFGWTGHPLTRPAAALHRGRVYVSWNGATEVARWQVLGGTDPHALRSFRTVRKRGFETSLPAPPTPLLAVRALDRSGRALGLSRVIRRD
jgi:Arylsulfotransferase (ASST)